MAAIQVKNVSPELHERLREAARGENMTLGAYILRALEREMARPQTFAEWHAARAGREPLVSREFDAAALIREGRDERTRQIEQRLGNRFLGDGREAHR